jgi:hypothetical protein
MAEETRGGGRLNVNWRLTGWMLAGCLFLLPLIAMQFTDEVAWKLGDFVIFGALLLAAGLTYEFAARLNRDAAYRTGFGVAIAASLFLVVMTLGVGLVGADGDPVNLIYLAVLAAGATGSLVTRFSPDGMTRTLIAVSVTQALVAAIALVFGLVQSGPTPVEFFLGGNAIFLLLWITSAWLFHKSTRTDRPR